MKLSDPKHVVRDEYARAVAPELGMTMAAVKLQMDRELRDQGNRLESESEPGLPRVRA